MGKVLARGHSRVPVYSGSPKNIIGLLLVGWKFMLLTKFLITYLIPSFEVC